MTKRRVATLALASLALVSVAATGAQNPPPIPGAVDVSRVEAGTYAVDPAHSMVSWKVSHFGFNDYFGLFGDVAGTMTLDPANVEAAKFDITIPIASVAVTSSGLRDHLLRAGKDGKPTDFFGPEPAAARFVSSSVTRTSDTEAEVTGNLTMNGKTNPVTLEVTLSGVGVNPMNKKATVGFHATGMIDRTAWGLNYAAPAIGTDVNLDISVAFERN